MKTKEEGKIESTNDNEMKESNILNLISEKHNLDNYHRLSNLWNLLGKAEHIPVNLSEYTEKVEDLITNVIKWYTEWNEILFRCGIEINLDFIMEEENKSKSIKMWR